MGKVPQGGSAQDPGPKFLYSVLGQHRVHAASVIQTARGSATTGSSASEEANSVPPGFARIHQKTLEKQEAARYETPANSKQSIDEELGIQNVTNITEDWYAQSESELVSAVKSVLQPMEVDEPPEEQPPQMSDEEASDVLVPDPGSGCLVTAMEDRALDTPGRFSRAPGDGRPITGSRAGSSGWQIMGRSTEG